MAQKTLGSVHLKAARLMKQGRTRDEAYEEARRTWREGGALREGRHHKRIKPKPEAEPAKPEKQSFSEAILGEE